MESPKEHNLNNLILKKVSGLAEKAVKIILEDKEVKHLQDYANVVSIKRLGFNDHGPVHMKQVALNALRMIDLLEESNVKFSLEKEEVGTIEDSKVAIVVAALLHDVGMSIGRDKHEQSSILLSVPIIERTLEEIYNDDLNKQVIVKSLILEAIIGHMGTQIISSLEAGLVLIADGCDMTKGRSRIPMLAQTSPKIGDIHKHSAASIEKVYISKGERRPIKITVNMSEAIGLFQIENVLFPKINSSPAKEYIELYAGVTDTDIRCYL
jgi:uncharacterized protein